MNEESGNYSKMAFISRIMDNVHEFRQSGVENKNGIGRGTVRTWLRNIIVSIDGSEDDRVMVSVEVPALLTKEGECVATGAILTEEFSYDISSADMMSRARRIQSPAPI